MSESEIPEWLSDNYKKFFKHPEYVHSSVPVKFLRLPAVCERTGLSISQIYRLQAAGKFPARIKLAVSTSAWIESEIQQWCLDRIKDVRSK